MILSTGLRLSQLCGGCFYLPDINENETIGDKNKCRKYKEIGERCGYGKYNYHEQISGTWK